MWKLNSLIAAAALAASGFAALPAAAAVDVYVDVAPPAPRYEVIPAPRDGFAWQPGYWEWRNGRHVWVRGRWIRERPGMYWHPSRWVQYPDGRWYLERGRWDRQRFAENRWDDRRFRGRGMNPEGDRDRDGIPNMHDRDRDGDGVPNRFDERPNNPYRY